MLQWLYSFSSKFDNIRVFCSVDQQFYAVGVNYYYYFYYNEDNGGGNDCETCDKEVSLDCFSL